MLSYNKTYLLQNNVVANSLYTASTIGTNFDDTFTNANTNINIGDNTQVIVAKIIFKQNNDFTKTTLQLTDDTINYNNSSKTLDTRIDYQSNDGSSTPFANVTKGIANPLVIFKNVGKYNNSNVNLVYMNEEEPTDHDIGDIDSYGVTKNGIFYAYPRQGLGTNIHGDGLEYQNYLTFMLVDDAGDPINANLQAKINIMPNPQNDILYGNRMTFMLEPSQIKTINNQSSVAGALTQYNENQTYGVYGQAVATITFNSGIGNISTITYDNKHAGLQPPVDSFYDMDISTDRVALINSYNDQLRSIAKSVLNNNQFKAKSLSSFDQQSINDLNKATNSDSHGYNWGNHPTIEFAVTGYTLNVMHHSFTYVDSQIYI